MAMETEEKAINPFNLERRKHPRFSIDLPAEYWPINISKSRPARTGDISEGGVLLYLPEKIAIDQYIGVKIFIGTGFESKPIEALVRAVWNDSHLGKKDYFHRIGGKFVDISAENSNELRNFLNAQINSGIPSELNIPSRLFSVPGIPEEDKGDGQPMVYESSQEDKWEPLQQLRDETSLDTTDIRKKDPTKLPRELIQDFQEDYSEEQRQNLYEKILNMGIPEKLHLAIFANRETRKLLIRDPNKMIALNVLKNAKVNENEVLQYAKRRDLSQDIILAIAQDQKWKKNYLIKLAIVSNPKTPLLVALYFLSHLHEKDLKSLSRDQNVSSVLRWHVQEILLKKK